MSSPSQPGRDAATVGAAPHGVARSLSRLDRFLPAWIGLAMAAGLLLGRWVPGISDALNAIKVGSVSLPIARQFSSPTYFAESRIPPRLKLSQIDQNAGTRRKARKGMTYGRRNR